MDGPTEPRGASRILVQEGPSHRLPWGRLPSQHPQSFFQQNHSSPAPSRECGRWKGKATPESDGDRRGSDRLEALSSGTVSSVLSAAWPQDGKAWLPTERLKSHSHLLPETSARRLTTLVPLLASELAPVPEEGTGPRQRGRGGWLHHTKRATDSGISETNLTLVFWHIKTVKIKAGLQRLRSSDWWYIFFSFGKAKAGGREKGSHNWSKTQGGKCFHT